jgi:predicted dehydrogenase
MKARVAVVGLGKMGLLHSSILGVLPNAELVALCEKKSILRRFAGKMIPGIPFVADVIELAGMNLDAVYITTPEASHFPIAKAVYENKIARNIFLEKPITASYLKAQELCKLASAAGGVNMVGYNRRYSVTFGKAKKVLEDGLLGKVLSFEGHAFSSDFVGAAVDPPQIARSKAVSDLGCHVIDLALWFFGPLGVTSGMLASGNEPDDWVHFKVKTPEIPEGEIKVSRCMKEYRLPEMAFVIKGFKGMMKVDEDKVEIKLENGGNSVYLKHDLKDNIPFFIGGTEYYREDMSFINAVLEGSKVEPDFEKASRVESMIEKVTNNSKEPQTI